MFIFTIFKGIRLMISTVVALVILTFALPYIVAVQPFRDGMLRTVLPPIDGQVTSGGASLGWLSPVRFDNVEITSRDGKTVIRIPQLRGEKAFWQYPATDDRGTFEVDDAQVSIVAAENGTNLGQAFAFGRPASGDAAPPPRAAATFNLHDADFTFQNPEGTQSWTANGLNLSLAIEPAATTESGQAELVVQPGTVLADVPITPAMCNDLLPYAVPLLAGATEASGRLSLEIDEWRIPLDEARKAQGSGRLVLHALDAASSPMVSELAQLARLPASIRVADEARVEFTMADGRVHHRGLRFGDGGLAIQSEGSVGLDRSLALSAQLQAAGNLLGHMPRVATSGGGNLRLPIAGTLGEPKIGAAAPAASAVEAVATAAEDAPPLPTAPTPTPQPPTSAPLATAPIPNPLPTAPPAQPAVSPAQPPGPTGPLPPATASTLPAIQTPSSPAPAANAPAPSVGDRRYDHLLERWRNRYR